jgi:energy-coupling factor transport system permease protein
MNSFVAGQYYPVSSPIHRLDPRTKLIGLFLYYILLFLCKGVYAFLFVIALGAALMVLSRVPLKVYLRSIRVLLIFIVFAAVFSCFFTQGTAVFQYSILRVTEEGVKTAAVMTVRLTLILFSALILTFSTTPLAVTAGLERLFAPLAKIGAPVGEIAMMMAIAIRFIPVMMRETETTMQAQQSRGADLYSGSLGKRIANLFPLLFPLFIGAFRRSEELANAMEARGYRGDVQRTTFHPLQYKGKDVVTILFFLFLVLAMSLYRWFL